MLLFFEGMLCNQRQSSLINLRNMRRPVVSVNVYRDGQWNTTTTDEIVPGDMISLQLVGDVEGESYSLFSFVTAIRILY